MRTVVNGIGAEPSKSREKFAPFFTVRVVRFVVSNPRPYRFEPPHRFGYVDCNGDALLC